VIVTAREDFQIMQVSNLPALHRYHEEGDESGIDTVEWDEIDTILDLVRNASLRMQQEAKVMKSIAA
jgi:hypothetical protein